MANSTVCQRFFFSSCLVIFLKNNGFFALFSCFHYSISVSKFQNIEITFRIYILNICLSEAARLVLIASCLPASGMR